MEDGQVQETELVQEMLKFLVYNCLKINPELIKTIEFILPSFISYFIQVYESEELDDEEDPS
jgi:hypothetical protein